jgi:3D (Asp-Asp-Asp) domain-containing protein
VTPSTPNKPKQKHTIHVREPTNDDSKLILEIKRHYVVNMPRKVIKHTKQDYESFIAKISFYTSGQESTGKTPNDPAYGITSSGNQVRQGVTIACPPRFPLGTIIKIDGFGKRICQDRGSKIYGEHFDLYVEDIKTAIRLGVQSKRVWILTQGG